MFPKTAVGERAGPFRLTINPRLLEQFVHALRIDSDARLDPSPNPLPEEKVVPMLLTQCREGESELLGRYYIAISRLLHQEQSYELLALPPLPRQWEYFTTLTSVQEKSLRGQPMQFARLVTEVWGVVGENPLFREPAQRLALSTSKVVVRARDAQINVRA